MKTYVEYQQLVEGNLLSQLTGLGSIPEKLSQAMIYSLMAGGKRLRPVLLLAACESAGGCVQDAVSFACALEMIHTYSLIHDDLPAMDNDDLRRGKPTNHKMFGEDVAILAGDGLLHAAMELMLKAACNLAGKGGVLAAEAIARRSGVTGMVAGQTLDVTLEGTTPDQEKVSYIHLHKTADLITASLEAGALLAGLESKEIQPYVDYGQHLGLAFQLVDDLLDIEGDAALLGKNTGMDAQLGKMTWIAVHGIEKTRSDAAEHIARAAELAAHMGEGQVFFENLAKSTLNRVQ